MESQHISLAVVGSTFVAGRSRSGAGRSVSGVATTGRCKPVVQMNLDVEGWLIFGSLVIENLCV